MISSEAAEQIAVRTARWIGHAVLAMEVGEYASIEAVRHATLDPSQSWRTLDPKSSVIIRVGQSAQQTCHSAAGQGPARWCQARSRF